MQALDYVQLTLLAGPSMIIGLLFGYILGGQRKIQALERLGIGLLSGVIGGIVVSLLLIPLVDPGDYGVILSILGFTGGIIFGALTNWSSESAKKAPKRHILFDPEAEEEEYEKQLREAMGTE